MLLIRQMDVLYQAIFSIQSIDTLHEREFDRGSITGPIATAGHQHHRTRSRQRSDLGIDRLIPRPPVYGHAALTDTATKKMRGDHDYGHGYPNTRIQRREHETLRATTRLTCDRDACAVDIRQGQQKIQGTGTIDRLQPERLRKLMPGLFGISISDHVPGEDNSSHAGQRGTALLHRLAETTLALRVVSVRCKYPGKGPLPPLRTIEVAGNIISRYTFKKYILHRVAIHLPTRMDDRR